MNETQSWNKHRHTQTPKTNWHNVILVLRYFFTFYFFLFDETVDRFIFCFSFSFVSFYTEFFAVLLLYPMFWCRFFFCFSVLQVSIWSQFFFFSFCFISNGYTVCVYGMSIWWSSRIQNQNSRKKLYCVWIHGWCFNEFSETNFFSSCCYLPLPFNLSMYFFLSLSRMNNNNNKHWASKNIFFVQKQKKNLWKEKKFWLFDPGNFLCP